MPAYRSIRDFDWLMLILVCAICALGVLQIFSATHETLVSPMPGGNRSFGSWPAFIAHVDRHA